MDDNQPSPLSVMDQKDLVRAARIHADEPQDYETETVESPPPDSSDFEDVDYEELPPEDHDPSKGEGEAEEIIEVEGEDVLPDEIERSEKSKEVRKKVASLIKPKWIIKFCDRMLSNMGPYALRKSEPKDWRLDPEDVELLADLLEVLKEEEDFDMWPTKYWLALAVVVIYALKFQSVYRKRYSENAIAAEEPKKRLEEQTQDHERREAEEEHAVNEVEHEEKMAKLAERLRSAKRRQDEPPTEDLEDHDIIAHQIKVADLLLQYPPDQFEWNADGPVKNRNGTIRKRRGGKMSDETWQSPITNKFCSKEQWERDTAMVAQNGGVVPDEILEAEIIE